MSQPPLDGGEMAHLGQSATAKALAATNDKRATLGEMYRPPVEIMFNGSFQEVRIIFGPGYDFL